MSHKMLDSLEGYLDNIAAAATQTAVTSTPLAELAAILAVSVDMVAQQPECPFRSDGTLRLIA